MNHARSHNSYITASQQVALFKIASAMSAAGLDDKFIADAINTAREYEGVADLLHLWANENSQKERDEIIADIQDLLDDCKPLEPLEQPYVKFNDLEAIAKDIRAFKDSLLAIVNEKSSISELSEKTGIPQPSLSRFFNSTSMPRRITLLKIAKALKIDALRIATKWSV